MGFIHSFGDARMPIWGVLAILSNFLLALFSGSGYRGFYFASLALLILFVVIYIATPSGPPTSQFPKCPRGS